MPLRQGNAHPHSGGDFRQAGAGQALLRSLIEESASTCRFIATCNYVNKIIPPLRSRFQEFTFRAPDQDKVALLAADILEQEHVTFDAEELLAYVAVGYPDIRKIIQLLQQNSGTGKTLQSPKSVGTQQGDWKFELLECLQRGDWSRARKVVCDGATREEHEDVYRFLYENIDKLKVKDKDQAVITIAEYLYRHGIVADTEINLAAAFIELGRV